MVTKFQFQNLVGTWLNGQAQDSALGLRKEARASLPLRHFKKSTKKDPQRTKTAQRTTKESGRFDSRKKQLLVL
jgi:hypothetical protein